ncbi:UbiA prenyltransferase family protein [Streptomyces aidingensis]|uniref:4-hydroxybenzoate polyprenyltransferase n=1 Tax=Streptomyces aidingensis TaxID=910347 RepID=A0A1I1RHI2_9ACTN|nr:UbiA prenyltransferase family protein [Streptomyces aidingensis]SFD31708.1 4-hydroxybenzoate polyprenyltransferase [Streptomyces aidingensis]
MTPKPFPGGALSPPPAPPLTLPEDPAGPPARSRARIQDMVALLRPQQWAKNVYSMALVALATRAWTPWALGQLLWMTAVFVFASAAVYVGNDLADRKSDRLHPVKRNRPLASGRVGVVTAAGLLAGCLAAVAALLATSPPAQWLPVAAYLLLNLAYSAGLKHVPLLDAFLVSIGFQLRLVAGHVAVDRPVSQWLMTAVLAVCLVLILGKRRHELVTNGPAGRRALRGYTAHLIDQMLVLCMAVTMVSTLVYLSQDAPLGDYTSQAVLFATPFLLFGLFRYLQVLVVERGGADPVRVLLRDRPLIICIALFALTFLLVALLAGNQSLPATTAWNQP